MISGCLSELSELDSELEWCLDRSWNADLPDRTPLCTPGCEGFLHLPLPKPQQVFHHDEPLLVLGIDLRALEDTLGTGEFIQIVEIFHLPPPFPDKLDSFTQKLTLN